MRMATSCRPARAGRSIPTARSSRTARSMAAARRCRSRTSRRTPSRCSRWAKGDGLDGTVELHFTYDEETGGVLGPKWLLERGLTKPDLAICAGFSYAVTVAHNGCLHLEVVLSGQQAHAAMPASGPRRAGGRRPGAGRDLRRARRARRHRQRRAGHRFAADHGRPDLGRGEHQRRPGPRRLPHRPAHHPGGGRRTRSSARWSRSSRGRCPKASGVTVACRR